MSAALREVSLVDDNAPAHVEADLSSARRIFTFGDIHGTLHTLITAMEQNGFNAEAGDHMIGLGDWLDRGPDSVKIADFIEQNRGHLHFIRGNHEQLLADAVHQRKDGFSPELFLRNGGTWLIDYIEGQTDSGLAILNDAGQRIVRSVCNAPIALTVKTPAGFRVGFVHAEVPMIFGRLDWETFTGILEQQGIYGTMATDGMWRRDEISRMVDDERAGRDTGPGDYVAQIDHVFHGHTILKQPLVRGNRSWIDTGAFRTGELTFVDIDKWVAKLQD